MKVTHLSLKPTVTSTSKVSLNEEPIFKTSEPILIVLWPSCNLTITEFVLESICVTVYLVSIGVETTSKLSPTLSCTVSSKSASESV